MATSYTDFIESQISIFLSNAVSHMLLAASFVP